jgi:hypothetical protein
MIWLMRNMGSFWGGWQRSVLASFSDCCRLFLFESVDLFSDFNFFVFSFMIKFAVLIFVVRGKFKESMGIEHLGFFLQVMIIRRGLGLGLRKVVLIEGNLIEYAGFLCRVMCKERLRSEFLG